MSEQPPSEGPRRRRRLDRRRLLTRCSPSSARGTPWLPVWRAHEARLVVISAASDSRPHRSATCCTTSSWTRRSASPATRCGSRTGSGAARSTAGCSRSRSCPPSSARTSRAWRPSSSRSSSAPCRRSPSSGCRRCRTSTRSCSRSRPSSSSASRCLWALVTLCACFAAQWVFAWRFTGVPPAKLLSAGTLSAALVVLFRGRMLADVRAFLTEKRELERRSGSSRRRSSSTA